MGTEVGTKDRSLAARAAAAVSGLRGRKAQIKLVVIDADRSFVTVLARHTGVAGWQLRHVASAVSPEKLGAMKLNALLLDPVVLEEDCWAYLERVCRLLPDLGVVVCTGHSDFAQRVRGLRLGVDDWITKPCHPEEAMARLEAVSRPHRPSPSHAERSSLGVGELAIRADQFDAFVGDRGLDLTRREFELLYLLAEASGRVLERESIYQRIWGYTMPCGDRSVDAFIRKLRQKLADCSPEWAYIHTHYGVGYRFDPERASTANDPGAASPRGEAATVKGSVPKEVLVAGS